MEGDAGIYPDEKGRQRPFSFREEGQDERGFEAARPELASFHQRLDGYYRKGFTGQWRSYAINGAFSILAGFISLILPVFLNSSALTYAGGILVARGGLTLISTLSMPPPGGLSMPGLSGSLSLLAGLCLVLNIFVEPASLVSFFAAYLVSTGIAAILLALSCRRQNLGHWDWLVVSGVLNLNLALICLSRLPEPFIWVLTIFLGLDLIAHGSALLAANNGASHRAVA